MNLIKVTCAALLSLMILPVFAQPVSVPFELAQRLAGPQTQIYVGTVPPKKRLAFELPRPPETRVVGSTASFPTDASFNWVTLYLASSRREIDFLTYYRRAFHKLGWRQGQTYEQTGFLGSDMQEPAGSLMFCQTIGDEEKSVYLTFANGSKMMLIDAQVQTTLVDEGWDACNQNNTYVAPPFPALRAPEGSQTVALDMLTGGPDLGSGTSLIMLKTGLGAKALLRHYAEQLELSGWREVTALSKGAVQLTTYRFGQKGIPFIGTLQITSLDEPKRYLAQLMVTKL